MYIPALYRRLDIKNSHRIKAACPLVSLDGFDWYDTSEFGFMDEILYLSSRGVIALHPGNASLVRFVESKPVQAQLSLDFKRLLRSR